MTFRQLTRLTPVLLALFFMGNSAFAQCPTLSQTCELDPCGGQNPCNLCPGDVITVANATGTNLKKGSCVNWYLGTTPNFNPYAGQGQLLGCSKIDLTPPDECIECPELVFTFIDACGTEAANEFLILLSGSGFYVDNAYLDFDDAANGGPANDDVNNGGSCNWVQPSAVAIASLQTACPGATIVAAGPGDIVPPGVIVMVYTSSGFNYNYNWGSLCPLAPTIYVMQNGCNRSLNAFPNGGCGGSVTTIFGIDCGCADASTYNCGSIVGGNGAFFVDYIFPFYGNAGCGFPNVPVNPPPPPPITLEIPPFDTTLSTGLCNMGPYYIVGIMNPLPPGCPQIFTNYMPFNVVCPAPVLQPGTVCNSVANFDLNDLADPTIPDGVWSGPNVVGGSSFNALNVPPGSYNLTFNPDSDCAINSTTTMTVFAAPKAQLSGGPQTVCAGQPVNLTVTFTGGGVPPYTFIYAANGVPQPAITALTSPHVFSVTPSVTTNYTMVEVDDINCPGTVLGLAQITVLPAPTAALTGNDTICSGQSALLFLNFTGSGPWTYSYSADGIVIDTFTTAKNPDTLAVSPTDTTIYKIVKVWNATCPGQPNGTVTILVPPATTGLLSGSTAICGSQPVNLTVDFSGGTAPWTFVYSINGVNQPSITTSNDPHILTVNPSQSTDYALVSVSGGSCPGAANGTATVTLAQPPTAVMTGNASICPGASTPISIDFNGGAAPWTFVYSINGLNQPPVTTSDDPYVFTVTPPADAVFELENVSSGSCIGMAGGTVNVAVAPNLTATISGGATIMTGGSATLVLNVPNAPPGAEIIYTLSENGVPIAPITTSQNPYNHNVMPLLSTVYLILSCTVNGCPVDPSGNAVVTISDPMTSATISGSDTICSGETVPLLISFFGDVGPFSFVYAINGVDQPSITTLSNPHVLMVSPTANALYTLTSAVIGGTPASDLDGVADIIVLNPVLNLTPSNIGICVGGNANLLVGLSGAPPPFTFVYSIDNVAQPSVTTNQTSFTIPVTPSVTTTYNLVSGSANGCATTFNNAQSTVTVSGPPTADNIQIVCNQSNNTYSVNFMVNSQPAPAGATLVNGSTVLGGQFFSTSIPISQPYSFQLSNGCGQSLVAGNNTCSCTTNAGTMSFLDTLEVCVGGAVIASHENDQTVNAGELFQYILHTNPGLPIGNIIATNPASPTFSFDAMTMTAGQIYFISAIAGNDNGSGQIDLQDTCLSVATGTPVVFFDPPTMTIEVSDTSVCPGTTVQLVVKMTGNGPFHFTYSQNGAPRPPVDTPNDNYTIGAVLQSNTTFQITSFNDATCPGFLPPPVVITVNQVPTILGQTDEDCDLTTLTYTVSATLTGGNGFYQFAPANQGTMTGAFFQSSPIPIGTAYNYLLSDTEQCGFVSLTGNPMCVCQTDAGSYPFTQPLIFCGSSPASLPPIFGSNLDPNDTLIYVLHLTAGQDPLLWTILQTNDQPFFTFIPGLMTPGQSYFISAIAANQTPAGIDFTDPCRSVSAGVEVIWAEPVSALLGTNTEICLGDTAHLQIVFSGNDAPYEFVLLENGVALPPQLSLTDTFFLNVNPSLSVNYSLFSVDGNNCPGSINGGGGAAVSVKLPPDMVEFSATCDFFSQTYIINFKITNGADTAKTWLASGTPGSISSDSVFTSDPIPFGTTYDVFISSLIGCEMQVQGLVVCNCSSQAGTFPATQKGDFCIGEPATIVHNGDDVHDGTDAPLHFILFSDPTDPKGSILGISPSPPSFDFDAATMTAGVIYYIAAIVGDDDGTGNVNLLDPCLSISQPTEIVFHEPPTAVLSGMASVCPGNPAAVQIAFTGTGPFDFQYAINGIPGVPISTNQTTFNVGATALNTLIFNLITVSDALCDGTVSGSAEITVKPIPKAQLVGGNSTCPGKPVKLSLVLTGGQSFTVQISNSEGWDTTLTGMTNGTEFWVSPVGPGLVSYSITALSAVGTDCPPEFGQPVFVNVEPLFLSMTVSKYGNFNISCPGRSDGSIVAAGGGGQSPYNFQWATGETTPSLTNLPGGIYALTMTDAGGCSDSISVVLSEPPPIAPDLRGESSDCFGSNEGSLSVEEILGGNGPYHLSLDGKFATTTDTFPLIFNNLPAGNYLLEIEDVNGCTAETMASVPAAQELLVDLGPDLKLLLGDSVQLTGQTNRPVVGAVWSPVKYLSAPDSVISMSTPTATIRYQLVVKDEKGCTATDFLLIEVDATRHIYVPNAFHPGGNGPNDRLTVFTGREVRQIRTFQVFDRWGDEMFLAENFQSDDPSSGWDGTMRGKNAAPAVYVWWLEVEFVDGEIGVFKGDVTLVR